jgi:hypothetical protein
MLSAFTSPNPLKHWWAFHSCALHGQNGEKAGLNTENIVQLASVALNLPEIYAGNSLSIHAVDSDKTSVGVSCFLTP